MNDMNLVEALVQNNIFLLGFSIIFRDISTYEQWEWWAETATLPLMAESHEEKKDEEFLMFSSCFFLLPKKNHEKGNWDTSLIKSRLAYTILSLYIGVHNYY